MAVADNVTGPLREGEGGPSGLVLGHGAQPDWRVQGNIMAQDERPGAPGWYGDLFVAATGAERPLEGLRAHPDGPLADGRAGAPRLAFDPSPGALLPVIRVEREPQGRNVYAFDAGMTAGPDGPLSDSPGATVTWRFPDGATAEGPRVEHALRPGTQAVEVAVRLPDGREARAEATVSVPSPHVLSLAEDEPIVLGGEPVLLRADEIAGYFGAADLALSFRFRAAGQGAAGEILRIHPGLVVSLGALGNLEVALRTAERDAVRLATAPLKLHDGAWHDAALAYDAATGRVSLSVDGAVRAQARTAGPLMPRESWGLRLGHPDPARSFRGELAHLEIDADAGAFRPIGGTESAG